MNGTITKREIFDSLKCLFDENAARKHLAESEDLIHEILDIMDIPSHRINISHIDFSPVVKVKYIQSEQYYKNLYGRRKTDNPVNEKEEEITVIEEPYSLIAEPDMLNGREIILGEYYPRDDRIVLYYNAIITYIAPIVYKFCKGDERCGYDRFYPENYCIKCLLAAISIVYAHEYFHAVHKQQGDFMGADDLLKESLARYFELLYCGVCPCANFSREYARLSRNSLKKQPLFYPYKGALTFDMLLGTQFPDVVKKNACRFDVYGIIAPRYGLFRDLFMKSECGYSTGSISFTELHEYTDRLGRRR